MNDNKVIFSIVRTFGLQFTEVVGTGQEDKLRKRHSGRVIGRNDSVQNNHR